VGIYQEQFLPRFQDVAMRRKSTRAVRARVCDGVRGDVVEIGFGTGLNAPYFKGEPKLFGHTFEGRAAKR
jgi:hypothetical protein